MTCSTRWEPDITRKTPRSKAASEGRGAAAIFPADEEYAAARLTLGELWRKLAGEDRGNFDVLAAAVEREFSQAVRRVTAADIAFVLEKRSERALKTLARTAPEWADVLSGQVRQMLAMLRDIMAGKFHAPWQTMAAVTAMMQYLMNPLDLVADSVPGLGHVDDALVVALCAAAVRKDLKRHAGAVSGKT